MFLMFSESREISTWKPLISIWEARVGSHLQASLHMCLICVCCVCVVGLQVCAHGEVAGVWGETPLQRPLPAQRLLCWDKHVTVAGWGSCALTRASFLERTVGALHGWAAFHPHRSPQRSSRYVPFTHREMTRLTQKGTVWPGGEGP